MSSRAQRLITAYRALALLALNTFVFFVLVNLIAAGWLALTRDEASEPAYDLDLLARRYPDLERHEVQALWQETWSRPYQYEPFTQFRESPFAGRFVNVDGAGFRHSLPQPPWPPSTERSNIFVFGGSTAFGYGLADAQTIPSQLSISLAQHGCSDTAIYNLARSNYYSTQERILFTQLLRNGTVPDIAVFIDGLNEFQHAADEPKLTLRLRRLIEETPGQLIRRALKELPLARLAGRLRTPLPEANVGLEDPAAARSAASEAIDRWLGNRRLIQAIATEYGVTTLFVWQPTPAYGYDLDHHPFAAAGIPFAQRTEAGYEQLRSRLGSQASDVLWLAELQRDRRQALYVDRVHYDVDFTREIATALAARLAGPDALACAPEAS